MGIKSLKTLAFDQIKASLTTSNILEELTSPFTLKYEEIKTAEFEYLKEHWVRHSDLTFQTQQSDACLGRPKFNKIKLVSANFYNLFVLWI